MSKRAEQRKLKLCVLSKIKENKSVLFGAFCAKLTKQTKMEAWKQVNSYAKSIGAIPHTKEWSYLRDVWWPNVRKATMVLFTSDEHLRGDLLKSNDISGPPSELGFDGNASFCSNISESGLISPLKEYSPDQEIASVRDSVSAEMEKSKVVVKINNQSTVFEKEQNNSELCKDFNIEVWPNATGRSMPLLDDIAPVEHQSESQSGENYLAPSNEEKTQHLEPVSTHLTCQKCHEVLDCVNALQTHVSAKHKAKLCKLCSFIFNDELSLEKHVNQSHTVAKENKNPSINKDCKGVFQCWTCLKFFCSQKLLKKHELKHETLFYRCFFCNKLNKSSYELNKHKSEHLTAESKMLLCKVCYKCFETNTQFTKHLKQQHHMPTNNHPDKMLCVICAFAYDDPNEFMLHMKTGHEGNYMVKRSGENKRTGHKSRQCRFCDIYCANLRLREVHMITVHGVPPYECAVCQAKLLTKAQFDSHILQHTKPELLRAGLKPNKRGLHNF